MKKLIAILLVLVMCLAIVSCNNVVTGTPNNQTTSEDSTSEDSTPEDSTPENTPPEIVAPEPPSIGDSTTDIVLNLNEKATVGNYEITVTDVRIVEEFVIKNNKYGFAGGDNYQVVVLYTLKNISKKDKAVSTGWVKLEYADGYEFKCNLMYNTWFSPDIFEVGGYRESYVELKTLSNEHYFLSSFSVPKMVGDNTEENLKIVFASNTLGIENSKVYYNIRPIDDVRKEALYQQALSLINAKNYTVAMNKLNELGEYKDSKTLYDECMKQWVVRVGISNSKAKEFINKNSNQFQTVTNSELTNMMVGTWGLSKGSKPWNFKADGTIDDGWGNSRWWSIEGDKLILKTTNAYDDTIIISDTLTVKRICTDGYILYNENGEFYSTLYISND